MSWDITIDPRVFWLMAEAEKENRKTGTWEISEKPELIWI